MQAEKLEKLKKLLDDGAITKDEFEVQKKLILREGTKGKRYGLIVGICVTIVICFAITAVDYSNNKQNSSVTVGTQTVEKIDSNTENTVDNEIDSTAEKYAQPLPVSISAYLSDNMLGMPVLNCTFTNNTDKEIAAIKLYFDPVDVYGEKVSTIFTSNDLLTDTYISAGTSHSASWQMLDEEIKSGDVYVYSVYFTDGSEWGNKDASTREIKNYSYKTSAEY